MAVAAGYSGKSLPEKLGYRAGQTVVFVALPPELGDLAHAVPFADVVLAEWATDLAPRSFDLIHAFTRRKAELDERLGALQAALKPDGTIWVSWPTMSAIEACRTAALGGHVEACEDCGHSRIAYNSCRNRHCPKCQGAAARHWLAAREADLLPGRLLPYRLHAAGRDRRHRLSEQGGGLRPLIPRRLDAAEIRKRRGVVRLLRRPR